MTTTAYMTRRGVKTYHIEGLDEAPGITPCGKTIADLIPAGPDRIAERRGLTACSSGCLALLAELAELAEIDDLEEAAG